MLFIKSKMIRNAKLKDLEQILDLLYQLSPPKEEDLKTDKKELRTILNEIIFDKNYIVCVYQEGQKLLGTATLIIQLNLSHGGRPYAHIENVVVNKNFRGKNIGKQIVDYLIKKANERNCYKIVLSCEKKNIPFYKKCNLNPTGEVEMRRNN